MVTCQSILKKSKAKFLKSKVPLEHFQLYLEGVCESAMEGLRPKCIYWIQNSKQGQTYQNTRKLSEPDVVRLFYKVGWNPRLWKQKIEVCWDSVSLRRIGTPNRSTLFRYHTRPSKLTRFTSSGAFKIVNWCSERNKTPPIFFVCIGDLTEHGCDEVDSDTYGRKLQITRDCCVTWHQRLR